MGAVSYFDGSVPDGEGGGTGSIGETINSSKFRGERAQTIDELALNVNQFALFQYVVGFDEERVLGNLAEGIAEGSLETAFDQLKMGIRYADESFHVNSVLRPSRERYHYQALIPSYGILMAFLDGLVVPSKNRKEFKKQILSGPSVLEPAIGGLVVVNRFNIMEQSMEYKRRLICASAIVGYAAKKGPFPIAIVDFVDQRHMIAEFSGGLTGRGVVTVRNITSTTALATNFLTGSRRGRGSGVRRRQSSASGRGAGNGASPEGVVGFGGGAFPPVGTAQFSDSAESESGFPSMLDIPSEAAESKNEVPEPAPNARRMNESKGRAKGPAARGNLKAAGTPAGLSVPIGDAEVETVSRSVPPKKRSRAPKVALQPEGQSQPQPELQPPPPPQPQSQPRPQVQLNSQKQNREAAISLGKDGTGGQLGSSSEDDPLVYSSDEFEMIAPQPPSSNQQNRSMGHFIPALVQNSKNSQEITSMNSHNGMVKDDHDDGSLKSSTKDKSSRKKKKRGQGPGDAVPE